MAIIKCSKGHYYDDSKYDECPMCMRTEKSNASDERTIALFSQAKSPSDDSKTVALAYKRTGCDPVVGWLVCTEGSEKGRDFRIHSGRNFIGRAMTNDIYLPSDISISRKHEGCIIYEPKKNSFIIMNGEGAAIYVNGSPIDKPYILKDYDEISIGSYKFDFVAYCREDKKW